MKENESYEGGYGKRYKCKGEANDSLADAAIDEWVNGETACAAYNLYETLKGIYG